MERSFYLLTYDIADPKRLAKVAKYMESIGDRVQDSVFEAYLTPPEVEKLLKKMEKLMAMKEDSLRLYVLCPPCRERVRTVGLGQVTPPPGVTVV